MDALEGLFKRINASFEEEHANREEIKKTTRALDDLCREMQGVLQTIHTRGADISAIAQKMKVYPPQFAVHFQTLKTTIKPEQYFKFREHWKHSVSQYTFMQAVVYWFETDRLISLPEIEASLGLSRDDAGSAIVPGDGSSSSSSSSSLPSSSSSSSSSSTTPLTNPKPGTFFIELEDYLIGLTFMPSELSRLCVNSVISEDFVLPLRISKFVNDLYAGFRVLNLKNETLRKRFDSIKYDVKKIEEVVYDLSIRGLLKRETVQQ
eukprot:TRINITY_DN4010_c0_g1_i2.p1 TRINITY_DN4010_c0_g1~~TRINITY_DN4010_c0_g1_i2.p1  ORF type:complete len:279 (-),score=60.80 TRINITY_DN4010_c0_g1_i2:64-855(-)